MRCDWWRRGTLYVAISAPRRSRARARIRGVLWEQLILEGSKRDLPLSQYDVLRINAEGSQRIALPLAGFDREGVLVYCHLGRARITANRFAC